MVYTGFGRVYLEECTMNYDSAIKDFRQARRRARTEQVSAWLTSRSADLLCFEEVCDLLQGKVAQKMGVQDIPLEAVAGSVGRCSDYTRGFWPVKDSDQPRWAGVHKALTQSRSLPPIRVYQVGDAYFVIDGNHRVSVARQLGRTHIEAHVIQIRTRVALSPHDQLEELAPKAEYAAFLERTHLDQVRPEADLRMTVPGQYPTLVEQIEAHSAFMGIEQKREVPAKEAAGSWYDRVYLPLLLRIREQELLQEFPGRTEADLWSWLWEHRLALEEALGWEVSLEMAAGDLVAQSRSRMQHAIVRAGSKLLQALTPDGLQRGPATGAWRQEREALLEGDCLFAHILVPVDGERQTWPAVAQAAELACREGARLLGLHVVDSEDDQQYERAQALHDTFARFCDAAGVTGKLAVEAGPVARTICDLSQWADLIVLGLDQAPGPQRLDKLNSGFYQLIRRCPTPVLAVPGEPSPLAHPLLAYDGTPKAREALFVAAYLALRGQVPLTVVTVREGKHISGETLAEAREYLEAQGVQATYVQESGPAAKAIHDAAQVHACDLILMGGYGRSPLVTAMRGSIVDDLVQISELPVLFCR